MTTITMLHTVSMKDATCSDYNISNTFDISDSQQYHTLSFSIFDAIIRHTT